MVLLGVMRADDAFTSIAIHATSAVALELALLWAGLCTLRQQILGLWAGTFLAASGLAVTILGITGVLFDEGIFGNRLMRLPLFSLLMLIAMVGLLLHIVALISRKGARMPQR